MIVARFLIQSLQWQVVLPETRGGDNTFQTPRGEPRGSVTELVADLVAMPTRSVLDFVSHHTMLIATHFTSATR